MTTKFATMPMEYNMEFFNKFLEGKENDPKFSSFSSTTDLVNVIKAEAEEIPPFEYVFEAIDAMVQAGNQGRNVYTKVNMATIYSYQSKAAMNKICYGKENPYQVKINSDEFSGPVNG